MGIEKTNSTGFRRDGRHWAANAGEWGSKDRKNELRSWTGTCRCAFLCRKRENPHKEDAVKKRTRLDSDGAEDTGPRMHANGDRKIEKTNSDRGLRPVVVRFCAGDDSSGCRVGMG